MSATIEFDDPAFHVQILSADPIPIASHEFRTFVDAITAVQIDGGVATITCVVADIITTYLLTANDARTYGALLDLEDRTRAITSEPFTLRELLSQNPIIETIFGLLDLTATSITVTFT